MPNRLQGIDFNRHVRQTVIINLCSAKNNFFERQFRAPNAEKLIIDPNRSRFTIDFVNVFNAVGAVRSHDVSESYSTAFGF